MSIDRFSSVVWLAMMCVVTITLFALTIKTVFESKPPVIVFVCQDAPGQLPPECERKP